MTESLASHLVNGLAGHGVDRMFAIPVVRNTELFRGLTEAGIAVVLKTLRYSPLRPFPGKENGDKR